MLKKMTSVIAACLLLNTGLCMADHLDSSQVVKDKIAAAKASIQSIDNKTLNSWIEDGEKEFVLLDIREPGEVSAAKIVADESMDIPRGLVEFVFTKKITDHDMPVVVYCKKGGRGALAAATLKELGYKNVYNLEGGILKWITEGYPVSNFFGEFEVKNFESNFQKKS